jgi:hypothetical protein
MSAVRPRLWWVLAAAPLFAQDRPLPLEDVIKEKAGHFRLTGLWVSGGAFDLRFRGGTSTTATSPVVRAYSGSAGGALNWTYLGSRTTAWANYAGDYSLASRSALDSMSQAGEGGLLRRMTPRFTLGFIASAQSLNLGARLFQQPRAARQLQSPNFGSSGGSGGFGGSLDPIAEAGGALPSGDVFALTLGANQRIYTAGLVSGFTFTPRTNLQLGASASQSEFPPTPGVNVQLPYTAMRGGYFQGVLNHQATQRTSVNWSWQGGESRAQGQRFRFVTTAVGVSRLLTPAWYLYLSGGGGVGTAFREGVAVPWLVQYSGSAGIGYAGAKQALLVASTLDAGDRLALGFLSTSQVNVFWNLRPPSSGWAFSARAGGVLLRSASAQSQHAGSFQVGLSRRLAGQVYALGEATYVTNVLFAPQRLLGEGNASGLLDTSAQRAVRLSIVYRPGPERK